MADCIAKNIKKKTVRVKESFLESLGKADRTVDERFVSLNADFNKQQKNGEKLQKEFRTYLMSMKVANQALRNFYDAANDVYAQDFHNPELFKQMTRKNEHFWEQYLRAGDRSLVAISNYCAEFQPVKVKIGKRGRKLTDYDSARHAAIAAENSAKRNDEKVQKAQEQLNVAKKMYEDFNNELIIELPEFHEARIPFFLNTLREFFKSAEKFHNENVKVATELCNHVEDESAKFTDRIDKVEKLRKAKAAAAASASAENLPPRGDAARVNKTNECLKAKETFNDAGSHEYSEIVKKDTHGHKADVQYSPAFVDDKSVDVERNAMKDVNLSSSEKAEERQPVAILEDVKNILTKAKDGIVDIFSPPEALYRVRVIHTYIASERDELSLGIGDVISVLPSPSFIDEGWALGVKEIGGDKGLFPLNFARRLDAVDLPAL